jgi:hypothetical protein
VLALNSCQNEKAELGSVQSIVTPTESLGEKIPGSYIVVFDDSKIASSNSRMANRQFTDRLEKSTSYRTMEAGAKNKINEFLSASKFDLSKVSNYFTTQFTGISVENVTLAELNALSNNPNVKSIYYDQVVANPMDSVVASTEQNQAKAGSQVTPCGIAGAGGFSDGSASKSWIWVIDTGIDSDHPDLNVVTDTRYAKSFIGTSFEDCNGHGTHVAGTAAAKNNDFGVVGVSAGAPVVPVRVFGCTGSASTSNILAAINHVGANDLPGDVVNMSLGGAFGANCNTNSPYSTALKNLGAAGTLVALAAGNSAADATTFSPACTNGTNIMTVASMTCSKTFSSFSNYNRSAVDVIATGSNVNSTWLNGGYKSISGTSMASPHVAGMMHARGAVPATNGSITFRGQSYPIAVK